MALNIVALIFQAFQLELFTHSGQAYGRKTNVMNLNYPTALRFLFSHILLYYRFFRR